MQKKIFLKPIDKNGNKVLVDSQGKKFTWPTNDSRNNRLCNAALKNDNSVKVRLVDDNTLSYGTAPLNKFVGEDSIVSDFPLLSETQIVEVVEVSADQQVMMNFIHNESVQLKPKQL